MPEQNGTQSEIWLQRDDGTRLAVIDSAIEFDCTRVVNNVGNFHIALPEGFDSTLAALDRRVLIWRKPVGGAMYLEFVGLIRRITSTTNTNGNTKQVISGPGLNALLAARVVAYYAGSAYASKTAAADDMMREIVRENLGASATDTARALPSTAFSLQADYSLGPSLTKSFSYRNVLDVLREISDAARLAGTPVYFDIEATGAESFEFRCYLNQRGQDRTLYGPIFGLDFGNIARPTLDQDAGDECNYAYGLGQGEGEAREVQEASDTGRTGRSLYARWEAVANAVNESDPAGVLDAADARVIDGRPVTTFTAELLSVPGAVYGKDWGFGDKITVTYAGLQFSAIVRAVTVSVDETGRESVDSIIEAIL